MDLDVDLLCTGDEEAFLSWNIISDQNTIEEVDNGDIVEFSATYTNLGPGNATGVEVTATYPDDKFSVVDDGGGDASTPGSIVFNLGSISSGSFQTVTFQLSVNNGASGGGTVETNLTGVNETETGLSLNQCVAPFSNLPVELVAFDARVDGSSTELTWRTASETNNAGFEVQHRYVDSSNKSAATFEAIDFVQGYGTTLEAQSYTFRVDDLEPGRHIFRLKQVDFDGSFEYSPQIEVAVEMPDDVLISKVYPNPFNPQATVSFGVRQEQQVQVALYDVLGRQVKVLFMGRPTAGTTQILTIDGTGLPSGTYLLQVVGERFVDTQRVTLLK